ncbi:isocitrate lyase/PEP mutase family protein [Streptomyces venezuelae]
MTTPAYEEFSALHRADAPLLLPNAWDHASAAALVGAGFRAVGTTSLGVAAAAGLPDGTGATRSETVRLARGLTRLNALISVDVEGGFSDDPAEVAALAAELAEAGAVGINIEDGRADGTLRDAGHQAEILAAVREAVGGRLFINARTDTYWLRDAGKVPETGERVEAYRAAGADGVFVPGLRDLPAITDLMSTVGETPLNILYAPDGPSMPELAEAGVARVSCGSLLFRAALGAAVTAARAVAGGAPPVAEGVPSYADTQALADGFAHAAEPRIDTAPRP